MNAQETHDFIEARKQLISRCYEEINGAMETFVAENGLETEHEVQVEDKTKLFRIYQPKGQFVYNVKLDVGLKAKK